MMKTTSALLTLSTLLIFANQGSAAEFEAVRNAAKGTVSIVLDQSEWSASEPITGKLIFQITSVNSSTGKPLDAINLRNPSLSILHPDDMAAVPLETKWRTVFFPTIKVGLRYELAFSLRADEAFAKLVRKEGDDLILFKPGRYRLSASVDSPVRPPWDTPPRSPFIELHQLFQSETKTITITPGVGQEIGADQAKKAIAAATEQDLKLRIVTFYGKRNVLSREDLLAATESAQGKAKAELAALYLSLNHPAKDLTFFDQITDAIKLTGHTDTPRYLFVRPQQRVRFTCDLANVHRIRIGDMEEVLTTKKQFDFDAPRGEGVYEMYDDVHKKAWGWMLVHQDKAAIAAAGLRPDTKALADKVAAALFAQDAKALKALAAPGFNAEDSIKKLRFKLGDGDIRFEVSTGTTTKSRARMKINLAPQGSPPVFARELLLDFVLVGDELKLADAKVWESEN